MWPAPEEAAPQHLGEAAPEQLHQQFAGGVAAFGTAHDGVPLVPGGGGAAKQEPILPKPGLSIPEIQQQGQGQQQWLQQKQSSGGEGTNSSQRLSEGYSPFSPSSHATHLQRGLSNCSSSTAASSTIASSTTPGAHPPSHSAFPFTCGPPPLHDEADAKRTGSASMGDVTSGQLSPTAGSPAANSANALPCLPPPPAPAQPSTAQPGTATTGGPAGAAAPPLAVPAPPGSEVQQQQQLPGSRWEHGFAQVLSRQQVREVQSALGVTPKSAQGNNTQQAGDAATRSAPPPSTGQQELGAEVAEHGAPPPTAQPQPQQQQQQQLQPQPQQEGSAAPPPSTLRAKRLQSKLSSSAATAEGAPAPTLSLQVEESAGLGSVAPLPPPIPAAAPPHKPTHAPAHLQPRFGDAAAGGGAAVCARAGPASLTHRLSHRLDDPSSRGAFGSDFVPLVAEEKLEVPPAAAATLPPSRSSSPASAAAAAAAALHAQPLHASARAQPFMKGDAGPDFLLPLARGGSLGDAHGLPAASSADVVSSAAAESVLEGYGDEAGGAGPHAGLGGWGLPRMAASCATTPDPRSLPHAHADAEEGWLGEVPPGLPHSLSHSMGSKGRVGAGVRDVWGGHSASHLAGHAGARAPFTHATGAASMPATPAWRHGTSPWSAQQPQQQPQHTSTPPESLHQQLQLLRLRQQLASQQRGGPHATRAPTAQQQHDERGSSGEWGANAVGSDLWGGMPSTRASMGSPPPPASPINSIWAMPDLFARTQQQQQAQQHAAGSPSMSADTLDPAHSSSKSEVVRRGSGSPLYPAPGSLSAGNSFGGSKHASGPASLNFPLQHPQQEQAGKAAGPHSLDLGCMAEQHGQKVPGALGAPAPPRGLTHSSSLSKHTLMRQQAQQQPQPRPARALRRYSSSLLGDTQRASSFHFGMGGAAAAADAAAAAAAPHSSSGEIHPAAAAALLAQMDAQRAQMEAQRAGSALGAVPASAGFAGSAGGADAAAAALAAQQQQQQQQEAQVQGLQEQLLLLRSALAPSQQTSGVASAGGVGADASTAAAAQSLLDSLGGSDISGTGGALSEQQQQELLQLLLQGAAGSSAPGGVSASTGFSAAPPATSAAGFPAFTTPAAPLQPPQHESSLATLEHALAGLQLQQPHSAGAHAHAAGAAPTSSNVGGTDMLPLLQEALELLQAGTGTQGGGSAGIAGAHAPTPPKMHPPPPPTSSGAGQLSLADLAAALGLPAPMQQQHAAVSAPPPTSQADLLAALMMGQGGMPMHSAPSAAAPVSTGLGAVVAGGAPTALPGGLDLAMLKQLGIELSDVAGDGAGGALWGATQGGHAAAPHQQQAQQLEAQLWLWQQQQAHALAFAQQQSPLPSPRPGRSRVVNDRPPTQPRAPTQPPLASPHAHTLPSPHAPHAHPPFHRLPSGSHRMSGELPSPRVVGGAPPTSMHQPPNPTGPPRIPPQELPSPRPPPTPHTPHAPRASGMPDSPPQQRSGDLGVHTDAGFAGDAAMGPRSPCSTLPSPGSGTSRIRNFPPTEQAPDPSPGLVPPPLLQRLRTPSMPGTLPHPHAPLPTATNKSFVAPIPGRCSLPGTAHPAQPHTDSLPQMQPPPTSAATSAPVASTATTTAGLPITPPPPPPPHAAAAAAAAAAGALPMEHGQGGSASAALAGPLLQHLQQQQQQQQQLDAGASALTNAHPFSPNTTPSFPSPPPFSSPFSSPFSPSSLPMDPAHMLLPPTPQPPHPPHTPNFNPPTPHARHAPPSHSRPTPTHFPPSHATPPLPPHSAAAAHAAAAAAAGASSPHTLPSPKLHSPKVTHPHMHPNSLPPPYFGQLPPSPPTSSAGLPHHITMLPPPRQVCLPFEKPVTVGVVSVRHAGAVQQPQQPQQQQQQQKQEPAAKKK